MRLISGTSNPDLAEAISAALKLPLTRADIRRFADHEVFVEVAENVRGEDVFVIESTSRPANDHLMELLILIDALKRGSARRITTVIPYFGYARQDRKTHPRSPISAKLVANLLTTAGAHRVLTLDLHSDPIQGFFDIPVDHLAASPVFMNDIKAKHPDLSQITIVSPDVGGVVRARNLAKRLDVDLAIIDKRRETAGISEVMHIIGDVAGRVRILVDDMVDSAGTLLNAAVALREAGAAKVVAYASHGVLSCEAATRVGKSPLTELVITDSIAPTALVRGAGNIRLLSVAPLLAEAIKRIGSEQSVSSLLD
jgi:ribose-phosphate pyrophosphokinase